MSASLRTLFAAVALALSLLVLTQASDLERLGPECAIAFVVVLTHGWIIAVGERAYHIRGGTAIRRAPLGPRIIATRQSLLSQSVVLALVLGLALLDWRVAAVATGLVLVASIDLLRTIAPFAALAFLPLYGLATMSEFHVLSDLMDTAAEWLRTLVEFGILALLLSGTLLRTDVSGQLPIPAKLVAIIAGLPGYVLAPLLVRRIALLAELGPVLALLFVMVAWGLAQTFIASFAGQIVGVVDRDPRRLPPTDPRGIGQALFAMGGPILAALAFVAVQFAWVPIDVAATAGAPTAAWLGVLLLLVVVPAVPAAVIVAASIDRLEQRPSIISRLTGVALSTFALVALVAWGVAGPTALAWMYAPGGLLEWVSAVFGIALPVEPLVLLTDGVLFIGGLPAEPMLHAVTAMVGACALLASRYMARATAGQGGITWGHCVLQLVLQGAATVWLLTHLGPVGAPLAAAGAAAALWMLDLVGAARSPAASRSKLDPRVALPGEQMVRKGPPPHGRARRPAGAPGERPRRRRPRPDVGGPAAPRPT